MLFFSSEYFFSYFFEADRGKAFQVNSIRYGAEIRLGFNLVRTTLPLNFPIAYGIEHQGIQVISWYVHQGATPLYRT